MTHTHTRTATMMLLVVAMLTIEQLPHVGGFDRSSSNFSESSPATSSVSSTPKTAQPSADDTFGRRSSVPSR